MATKEAVKPLPVSKPGRKVQVIDIAARVIINEEGHAVSVDGVEIHIAPKEFRILLVLYKATGKTLSRADILREVWGAKGKQMDERTVDQHIARLRRKINAAGLRGAGIALDVIKTQNSFGYIYRPV